MDQFTTEDLDVRSELRQLEDEIEALSDKLHGCRKFMAAGRGLIAATGLLLAGAAVGFVRFDGLLLVVAIAGALGGMVLLGSNRRTAAETEAQLDAAEARRTELIDRIDPRSVN